MLTNDKVRKTIEELKASNIQASMLKIDDIVNGFMEIAFNEENFPKDRMRAMEWLSDHIGLASKEQQARIAKLKAETKRISEDKQEKNPTINVIMQGDVSQYAE
jgi:hypothetical protein